MKRKLMNRTTLAIICAMSALCAVGAVQKPTAKKTSFSESELRALAKAVPDVKNAGQLYSVALATSNDVDRQQSYLKASAAGLIACGKPDIYKKHIKSRLQNVAEFEDGLKDDCEKCSGAGAKERRCYDCKGEGQCSGCKGSGETVRVGFDNHNETKPCRKCKGSGRCPKCGGEGSTKEKCFACAGTGKVFSKTVAARVFRDSCNTIADGVGIVAPQNKTKNNSEVNVKPEVAGKAVGSKECQSDVTKSQTTRRRRRESGERNIPQQDVDDDVSTAAKSKVEKKGMEVAAKQKSSGDKDLSIDERIKAAENGDVGAQLNLALMYGLRNDNVTAAKWYRKAAELGDASAQTMLAWMYVKGWGVAKNEIEIEKWFRKGAEQGYAAAQYGLGYCYKDGIGVEQNESEAIKWYRKAAEQGFANAQYELGNGYFDGEGITQDKAEAVRWFRKAAEQGHIEAQSKLASCYFSGSGVTKDYVESVKWYQKMAEKGNAKAQYMVGLSYYGGIGTAKDHSRAATWFRKAAEQEYSEAQYELGRMYFYGTGVARDEVTAIRWFRKAAEQGNAKAQYILGVSLVNGQGVEQDEVEALKWIRKAAEQGISELLQIVDERGRTAPFVYNRSSSN
ncbi:MAG: SEL1-like repeat protein [Bacteroidales bacterium]|nr:SEL1-like repeat protein [Bacteroidales bacterium]